MKKYKTFKCDVFYCPIYNYHINMVMYDYKKVKKFVKEYEKVFGLKIDDDVFAGKVISMDDSKTIHMIIAKNSTIGVVVHESIHVCQMIFEDLGLHDDLVDHVPEALKEAQAYYIEFIFNEYFNRFIKHLTLPLNYITKIKFLK